MAEFSVIGKPLPRVDSWEKATGTAIYGVDVNLPRLLFGKILRSPLPHAGILNIDTSRAERLRGVRAVVTCEDSPKIKFGFFKHKNPIYGDCHPLKCDKVRCLGDEVAAVAAVDEDVAEEALELISVEYQELPAIFDPLAAIEPGAPQVHQGVENNILNTIVLKGGDIEAGFGQAEVILQDRYRTGAVAPCCMEPHQALAAYDLSGRLTVWSSTQMPFYLRAHLADVLGIAEGMVRVLKTTMGSGFGSRMEMHPLDPICALLAHKAGRPVKIVYSREEEFSASRFRHPMTIDLKLAAKLNGELVAAQMDVVLDCGAYCSQAPGVVSVAGTNALSMYQIPNVSYIGKIVYTNNPYGGSFRGYGNSQTTFALESLLETLAEQLGLDPVAVRRMNSRKTGQVTPLGHVITSCGFVQCLEEAAARIGWDERRGKSGNRGVGLAGLFHVGGGARVHDDSDGCGAFVKVEDNGSVMLITGAQEIGQGANTVLSQIVAEELGVALKDVRIENSDTDIIPWDLGCHASRTTFVGGNAAKAAAGDAREQLFDVAAQLLEASPRDLKARAGKIYVVGSEDKFVTISQAASAHHYRSQGSVVLGKAFYDPPTQMPDPKTGKGNKSAAYAFGVQAAEVEVDMQTGEVKLLKLVSALDVGRAINPLSAHGQAQGCLGQGVGYALSEELVFDQGKVVNPSMADYKIPAAPDMPVVESVLVETIDPLGPFGAKGMGESGLVPTAPAIVNAVYDATGVRVKELPVTPEKLLRAIRGKSGER